MEAIVSVKTDNPAATLERTEHPHIVRVPDICGGEPILRNTRIPVRLIAEYYKTGTAVEEVQRDYPHLNPAAIYDAISYYIDNQAEIEELIEANKIENVLRHSSLTMDENGVIHPIKIKQPHN